MDYTGATKNIFEKKLNKNVSSWEKIFFYVILQKE